MLFSLNNRQDSTYLKKADEILIQYRDRKAIPDYAEKYPQAALVVDVGISDLPIDYTELKDYSVLSRGKLTIGLPIIQSEYIQPLKDMDIPYFYSYPVSNAWELKGLIKAGVSQVRIEAPLFFQTDVLKSFNIPLRVVPNVACNGHIPTVEGIIGSWIRPEDLRLYEDIFTTIEFLDCDKNKEQALYRIYAEQKEWPGSINMLISNVGLDSDKVNRLLPEDFTNARLNCGQRCTAGSPCRKCYRYISLTDPALIKEYSETILHD